MSLPARDSTRVHRAKFQEYGLKYSQFDRGFFQGQFSIFVETDFGFGLFRQHEIAAGYSPWKNALTLEMNHRYVFFVLSAGGGVGYCSRADFSSGQFFFKPEAGLNLFLCQIYYTYSFTSTNETLYNTESNLTVSFPIRSSNRYRRWGDAKRWRWWGAYWAVDRGDVDQY